MVSLSTSTAGATIRYTLDGSEPNEYSNIYSNPISILQTTTLKAKAYKTNWIPSTTISRTYRVEPTWNYCSSILNNGVYHISQPQHLNCIRQDLNGSFVLDNDIDLTGINFEPIGNINDSCYFYGSFDGQNHIISNLYINRPSDAYVGLFNSISHSDIKNLSLYDVNIIGGFRTGALAAFALDSNISNSYSTGVITGIEDVGGLIGYLEGSRVNNCNSTVNVSGNKNVGGLVGTGIISGTGVLTKINDSNSSGIIIGKLHVGGFIGKLEMGAIIHNSRATGNVTGETSVGGFVGWLDQGRINWSSSAGQVTGSYNYTGGFLGLGSGTGFITESYSTGNVTNNSFNSVGGFAGHLSLTNGQVNNCYSRGDVIGYFGVGFANTLNMPVTNNYSTGSADYGGFGSASNCIANYWDVEKSGQVVSGGCGEGKTTPEMKDQNTFTGWDFNNTWAIDPTINDGYPYLINNPPQ